MEFLDRIENNGEPMSVWDFVLRRSSPASNHIVRRAESILRRARRLRYPSGLASSTQNWIPFVKPSKSRNLQAGTAGAIFYTMLQARRLPGRQDAMMPRHLLHQRINEIDGPQDTPIR